MSEQSPAENLAALRDAVVAELRRLIPGVKSIEPHGGSFDEKELQKFALLAPAIRVAMVGIGQVRRHNDGMIVLPVNFAAMCVARDGVGPDGKLVERDVQAMMLANAVTLAVYGNRFDLDLVYQPENVTGRNEYSGSVQGAGLTLWQVAWTSPVCMGESADDAIAALSRLIVNDLVAGGGPQTYRDFGAAP